MSNEALDAYYSSEYVSRHQRAQGVTEKELRVQAGRARHLVRLLRGTLPTVTRHLDVGSSTGTLMGAIGEAYGCESVGIEPAETYRQYTRARGLTVYRELEDLTPAGEARFDLITLAHVLEHLADPVEYLMDLRERWLTVDGTILVEVPNLFGHFSLERPHLICFHAGTLRRALAGAGLVTARLVRHGVPRSRLIPLYLTALSRPALSGAQIRARSNPRTVRFRRVIGMLWQRLATRLLPGWAWLPLPEGWTE